MTIHPVKTEKDYSKALLRIDGLMAATPNTEAGDELDVLATLVEAYERDHFTIQSTRFSPPSSIFSGRFQ